MERPHANDISVRVLLNDVYPSLDPKVYYANETLIALGSHFSIFCDPEPSTETRAWSDRPVDRPWLIFGSEEHCLLETTYRRENHALIAWQSDPSSFLEDKHGELNLEVRVLE